MRQRGRPRKDYDAIKRFSENLNRILEEEKPHLTQQAIANALGVKRQAVSYWLSGQGKPNYENLVQLAEFLDKDVEELTS